MKNKQKKPELFERLGLNRINFQIFLAGIITIILGYVSLALGDTNDVWSLTVGPILLVLGYVVLLPLALAYRRNKSLPEK
jgi:general stress protein CsbA